MTVYSREKATARESLHFARVADNQEISRFFRCARRIEVSEPMSLVRTADIIVAPGFDRHLGRTYIHRTSGP